MTENSTTFEIGLLVPGLIAPLDPKAGIVLWRNHASGRCGECPLSGPFPPFGQQPLIRPKVKLLARSTLGSYRPF